jgi:hypothetical protein
MRVEVNYGVRPTPARPGFEPDSEAGKFAIAVQKKYVVKFGKSRTKSVL